jgi:hypothetical protein
MGGEGVTDNHGVKWMLSFIVALSRSLALGSLLALLAASPCRAEVVLIQP